MTIQGEDWPGQARATTPVQHALYMTPTYISQPEYLHTYTPTHLHTYGCEYNIPGSPQSISHTSIIDNPY